jgi:SAM-dependent methyltransferase
MEMISVRSPKLETRPLDEVWDTISADVTASVLAAREFPLSRMSRSVAEELWKISSRAIPKELSGLDVGTGTGVHAILMVAKGIKRVVAIDVNNAAVQLASARADRVLDRSSRAAVTFLVSSLDDADVLGNEKFGVVTFNPPSFFRFGDSEELSPACSGVYIDHGWQEATKPEHSLLYRFFERVVLPKLAIGGHVICSWPGLERRLVEDTGDTSKNVGAVSPARLLNRWFGIEVVGDSLAPTDFFRHTAVISSYGLGPNFWTNLSRGIATGLYSQFVEVAPQPSFRYGILHLVRVSQQHFKTIGKDVEVLAC